MRFDSHKIGFDQFLTYISASGPRIFMLTPIGDGA